MAWSIDVVRPKLNYIFSKHGLKYIAQHPESNNHLVLIRHEGELPLAAMVFILELFPELVYVEFHQNTVFPTGETEDGRQE